MAIGLIETLRAMVGGDQNCHLAAEHYDWYNTSESEDVLKAAPIVGNGSCVLLVQDRLGVPHHSLWRKGPIVKGNKNVPAGTAIAAGWDDKGKYPSHQHHNHAAIFLSEMGNGLVVIDQWPRMDVNKFRPHTLRFGNTKNPPSNDGNSFYVILTDSLHV